MIKFCLFTFTIIELEVFHKCRWQYKLSILCGASLHLFECMNVQNELLDPNSFSHSFLRHFGSIQSSPNPSLLSRLKTELENYPKRGIWPLWQPSDLLKWLKFHEIRISKKYECIALQIIMLINWFSLIGVTLVYFIDRSVILFQKRVLCMSLSGNWLCE